MFCHPSSGTYVLAPIFAAGVLTLLVAAVYAFFGIRRWTAILGYPAVIVQVPLMLNALGRRTFVWGGRRYRWHDKFDVEVRP